LQIIILRIQKNNFYSYKKQPDKAFVYKWNTAIALWKNSIIVEKNKARKKRLHNILSVTQTELYEFLLNVAPVRPVFIWGAPGIGKSSIVENFAEEVGMDCVSLLGSQLAPEDIIGVPFTHPI